MARTPANSQAADAEEAIRVVVEEERRKSDARVAQLEHEHHAACLAAYEEYAKFITEKDDEVASLKRVNAELVAASAKQAASVEHLESAAAEKDAMLEQKSDLLEQKDVQIRNHREVIRGQVAYNETTVQAILRLESEVNEKDRTIKQLQDSRVQSKRAMQENIARKQDHIEALEDLLAEKEDIEQTKLKLEQVISRKANEIQEWKKYADTLEDTVRNRDSKIEKLKATIEKHERTVSDGPPRLYSAAPPSWRLRELMLREQERARLWRSPLAPSLGPTEG